jgi:hypothetical protein
MSRGRYESLIVALVVAFVRFIAVRTASIGYVVMPEHFHLGGWPSFCFRCHYVIVGAPFFATRFLWRKDI